jgi:hypothetical protein
LPITKSTGATPTERLLGELCERSFLKLWSYPQPIKDDGKELCDLLAVFENHVFIFFDRESRKLDGADHAFDQNWERWKRKVIDNQVRTAHGADRYIRSGREIFLDAKRTAKFPIDIDLSKIVVHKIIVAHGAKEACQAFSEDNVSGSLGIAYSKKTFSAPPRFPFVIDIDSAEPVHVLDSHNLPIIFEELDTFFDLTSYLDAKIDAIKRFDSLWYCGEEDLLAHYFLNFDEKSNRHVIGPRHEDYNSCMIGEGEWKDFVNTAPYLRRQQANESSYLWDAIIQKTCQNALDGTLLGDANVLKGKSAIHEMAKEPRFSRRALADAMIKSIQNFPEIDGEIIRNVSFMPSFYEDKGYVFLQLRAKNIADYDNDYRPKRQALLQLACAAAKNKFSHLNKVIGIAIDAPKFSRKIAEDFILLECNDWPLEMADHYRKANEGINFFNTDRLIETKIRVKNFP